MHVIECAKVVPRTMRNHYVKVHKMTLNRNELPRGSARDCNMTVEEAKVTSDVISGVHVKLADVSHIKVNEIVDYYTINIDGKEPFVRILGIS